SRLTFPLTDEAHVAAWLGYERESRDIGVFPALQRHFVQLRFPIKAGISGEDAYRQATRKGILEAADQYAHGAVALPRPAALPMTIVPTIAGRVPVIVVGDRNDFVRLVQAFSERN